MSFEQDSTESPILFAARALLSLTPAAVQIEPAPLTEDPRLPLLARRFPNIVIPPSTVVSSTNCTGAWMVSSAAGAAKKKTVAAAKHHHRHRIVNLPVISLHTTSITTQTAVAAVSSCGEDSSVDGSTTTNHSEWTTTTAAAPTTPEEEPLYYTGSVSLCLPNEDEESLSLLHCFMRRYCVEAFAASSQDVSTPRYGKSHGRSIVVGQVGIQCIHCQHRPYAMRQERAVCFPSSLQNIYHSIETWQRRHSLVCQDIPHQAKVTMMELMGKSRSGAGGRRQYWEESAGRLGMVDTPTGIRFARPPGTIAPPPTRRVPTATLPMAPNGAVVVVRRHPLVFPQDRQLVTDYLFTLLNQMELCFFSEQDRVGGRSKVKDCPIGYPGLQCKHCGGKAGFGRYFPISIPALTSANSDRNIFNHVDKCRRCPPRVRQELTYFLSEQEHSKNRRGNRKLFFQIIWERMHGPMAASFAGP